MRRCDGKEFPLHGLQGPEALLEPLIVLQQPDSSALVVMQGRYGRDAGRRVSVDEITHPRAKISIVVAFLWRQLGLAFPIQRHGINVPLGRSLFGALIEDVRSLGIDPIELGHHPIAAGQLPKLLALHIVQIDMIVAVLFAGDDESLAILQEGKVVRYVDIGLALFGHYHAGTARAGIGQQQFPFVL